MLSFIFTALVAIPHVRGASTTVSVNPATNVHDPSESFTIDIDISDVTDLASWEMKLRFDNEILTTDSTVIVEGGFLQSAGSTNFYGEVGPSLDYVIIGCVLAVAGGASGSGTLASVTFTVLDTGSCSLHLYDSSLYDSAFSEISHSTTDGEFHTTYYRPVAIFEYSPSPKPEIYEPVTFDASDSYDTDGSIVEYEWNFGDGNITATSNPTIIHTYTAQGTFIVSLTVTDDDSPPNTDSTSGSVKIVFLGDGNEDNKVDWKDLLMLARAYGATTGSPSWEPGVDFNSDGKIDWKDLLVLARAYGNTC